MQPLSLSRKPGSGCTFVRIPGTLCDDRLWHKLDWPVSWMTQDVDLNNCRNLEETAADILSKCPGYLVPVGFSMGGMIALEMARQAPERIAGLVLIGTNHLSDHPQKQKQRNQNLIRLEAIGLSNMVREELIPRYFAGRPDPEDCEAVIEMAHIAGPQVLQKQYEALASRRDHRSTLGQLKSSVLVISGEHDRMCDPGQQQAMGALATESDIHILQNAGHMVPLEAPHELMRAMTQWVKARIKGELCQIAS